MLLEDFGEIVTFDQPPRIEWKISKDFGLHAEDKELRICSPPFYVDNELAKIIFYFTESHGREKLIVRALSCNNWTEFELEESSSEKTRIKFRRSEEEMRKPLISSVVLEIMELRSTQFTVFVEFYNSQQVSMDIISLPSSSFGRMSVPSPQSKKNNSFEDDAAEELLKALKDMYLDKTYCDFTFHVGDQQFQAHKLILSSRSKVFAAMMQHDMMEKGKNSVDINDCEPRIFHEFLLYLYSGKVEKFSDENVFELYKVADKYDVNFLKVSCVEFLKSNLSVDMFCDVIQLAVNHNEIELVKVSKEYFQKNAYKILTTENWLLFMRKNASLANELYLSTVPQN